MTNSLEPKYSETMSDEELIEASPNGMPMIEIHKACGGSFWVVCDKDNKRIKRVGSKGEAQVIRRKWCAEWFKARGINIATRPDLQGEGFDRYGGKPTKSNAIRTLAKEGLTIKEIMNQLGISYQHVYNTLKKRSQTSSFSDSEEGDNDSDEAEE